MQLLESTHRRPRSRATTAISVVAHVALLTFAVIRTAHAGPKSAPEPPQHLIYIASPVPESPAAPPPTTTATGHASTSTSAPVPTVPAIDFHAPTTEGIPPVETHLGDPSQGALDQIASRIGEPSGVVGSGRAAEVYTEAIVERPVVALPGAAPRYPEMLRGQGLEGRVVARFVVDTLGRVEPATVQIVSAGHAAFVEAVRRALPAMRFRPAEAAGHRVRQLVDIPFDFVLNR